MRSPITTNNHSSQPTHPSVSNDRTLRPLPLLAWPLSFPFLIAHGARISTLCPVLGAIPFTFSALHGALHLARTRKTTSPPTLPQPPRPHAHRRRRHALLNAFDIFSAAFLLGTLIPGWISLAERPWRGYWPDAGMVMLGTYGTVGLMLAFALHAYFALRDLRLPRLGRNMMGTTCSHCHASLRQRTAPAGPSAAEYQPLHASFEDSSRSSEESFQSATTAILDADAGMGEGRASTSSSAVEPGMLRPSTDDETARLL